MIDPSQQDMDDLLEVTEIHQKEQRVLGRLLRDLRSQANHHLVLQVHMCKFLPHLTVIPTTFDGDSYDI